MDYRFNKNSITNILLLILAGEAVFILPFVLPRIFRATVLDVFQITNTELGYCFSIYGLVALASYLLGGPFADKYPPRKLMGAGLILTALGGFIYANNPSLSTLQILYGYWGFTTILLFWAAMIKATRVWGGIKNQGKAFGFLDGGRGLVGALFGVLGVFIFSVFVSSDESQLSPLQKKEAFTSVIYTCSIIVSIIGILVFFFLKTNSKESDIHTEKITLKTIKTVLKLPSVVLLMIIILCAYVGYKITDIFSQYAKEVMGYSEINAAKTGTFLLFIRPVVGVIIGFLADRSRASLYLIIGFALSIIGSILFASGILDSDKTLLFFVAIMITAVGIYAARVLYFAVMKEGNIPLVLTGTAVGIISFIGYTPDIFAGPMIGYFLDGMPGRMGHQAVFWVLTGFSSVGLITSIIFYKISNKLPQSTTARNPS